MVENGQKWLTTQICHILNFALHAHCVHGIPYGHPRRFPADEPEALYPQTEEPARVQVVDLNMALDLEAMVDKDNEDLLG